MKKGIIESFVDKYSITNIETNEFVFQLFVSVMICLLFGFLCSSIAKAKNRSGGFWWGFFLNFIGLIIVICMKERYDLYNKATVQTREVKYKQEQNEKLERLTRMRDSGAITNEQFEELMRKL